MGGIVNYSAPKASLLYHPRDGPLGCSTTVLCMYTLWCLTLVLRHKCESSAVLWQCQGSIPSTPDEKQQHLPLGCQVVLEGCILLSGNIICVKEHSLVCPSEVPYCTSTEISLYLKI